MNDIYPSSVSCTEEGCDSQFGLRSSFVRHLRDLHGMEDETAKSVAPEVKSRSEDQLMVSKSEGQVMVSKNEDLVVVSRSEDEVVVSKSKDRSAQWKMKFDRYPVEVRCCVTGCESWLQLRSSLVRHLRECHSIEENEAKGLAPTVAESLAVGIVEELVEMAVVQAAEEEMVGDSVADVELADDPWAAEVVRVLGEFGDGVVESQFDERYAVEVAEDGAAEEEMVGNSVAGVERVNGSDDEVAVVVETAKCVAESVGTAMAEVERREGDEVDFFKVYRKAFNVVTGDGTEEEKNAAKSHLRSLIGCGGSLVEVGAVERVVEMVVGDVAGVEGTDGGDAGSVELGDCGGSAETVEFGDMDDGVDFSCGSSVDSVVDVSSVMESVVPMECMDVPCADAVAVGRDAVDGLLVGSFSQKHDEHAIKPTTPRSANVNAAKQNFKIQGPKRVCPNENCNKQFSYWNVLKIHLLESHQMKNEETLKQQLLNSKQVLPSHFHREVKCMEASLRCERKFKTREKLDDHLDLDHDYREATARGLKVKSMIQGMTEFIICTEPKKMCKKTFKQQGPKLLKQHLKHSHKYTEQEIEDRLKFYFEQGGNKEIEYVVPNLDILFEGVETPIVSVDQTGLCTQETARDLSPPSFEERNELNTGPSITEQFENLGYCESTENSDTLPTELEGLIHTQSVPSPTSPQGVALLPRERATFNLLSEKYENTHQLGEKEKPQPKAMLAVKKSQRKSKNVSPIQTVHCQICDKHFTITQNLRRHYKNKHLLDTKAIEDRMKNVRMTQRTCIYCQGLFTRLTTHHTRCKKAKEALKRAETVQEKPSEKIPKKFVKGAATLIRELEEYGEKSRSDLKPATLRLHLTYTREFLHHLEREIEPFIADRLLSLDAPRLPSIEDYLKTKKPSMKSHYLSANQFLIKFLISKYHSYDVENSVNITITTRLIDALRVQHDINKYLFSGVNKEKALKWASKRQKAQEDGEKLEVNMDRTEEVCFELLNSDNLKDVLKDFVKTGDTPVEHQAQPCFIRDLLISLLIIGGGGNRQSVPCQMTIKEFSKAKQHKYGWEVSVSNHKTKLSGAACLPFMFQGLYEACVKYRQKYRANANEEELFFCTENGNAVRGCNIMPVINHFVQLTPQELKTLNTKPFRKVWSGWNVKQSSATAARGAKVMRHSEKTRDRAYLVLQPGESTLHSHQLISKIEKNRRKRTNSSSSEESIPEFKKRKLSGKPKGKRQRSPSTSDESYGTSPKKRKT